MSEFNVGDRVRVAKVKWAFATDEEKAIIGREGVVVDAALFVRVLLDDMPDWWPADRPLPLVEDELEKL